jgi:hypothetical protein
VTGYLNVITQSLLTEQHMFWETRTPLEAKAAFTCEVW